MKLNRETKVYMGKFYHTLTEELSLPVTTNEHLDISGNYDFSIDVFTI